MPKPADNYEPAVPNGTVAIFQHEDLLCLGIKGDDGVWRDKYGCVLAPRKIVSVFSASDADAWRPSLSERMSLAT